MPGGLAYFPVPDGNGGYSRYPIRSIDDFWFCLNHYYQKGDDFVDEFVSYVTQKMPGINRWYEQWLEQQEAYNNIRNGENPVDVQGQIGLSGSTPNATMESYIANATSQYNTGQAQDYNTWTMNNNLISQGSQLSQLGLSPSGVLQTGGSTGVGIQAAETSKSSGASLKNQAQINKYNQQMGLAKSLISTAGSMASSGIYGAALGAVKHGASQIAGAAAHSGLKALQATKQPSYLKYLEREKFEVDENGLLKF